MNAPLATARSSFAIRGRVIPAERPAARPQPTARSSRLASLARPRPLAIGCTVAALAALVAWQLAGVLALP